MDDALLQAHRRAEAQPRDPAARQAYAQQLLRAGHRAAAVHERLALGSWDDLPSSFRLELEPGVFLSVLPGAPARVAPPDRDDPRLAHAGTVRVWSGGVSPAGPLLLFALPSCPTCFQPEGPPAVECPRCEGRGQVVEFTGRAEETYPCEDCDGEGFVPCPDCDGSTIPDLDPPAASGPCDCGLELETEYSVRVWESASPLWGSSLVELARCPGCGLGALRRHQRKGWSHACRACGWLACRCQDVDS